MPGTEEKMIWKPHLHVETKSKLSKTESRKVIAREAGVEDDIDYTSFDLLNFFLFLKNSPTGI